jgi:hypothetical protein
MSRSKALRTMPRAGWAALAAVLLAVGVGLWLAFSPSYQGTSETVSSSGAVTSTSGSATLIAVNGSWVIFLLCVPVILAALGLLGAVRGQRVLVWVSTAVLLGFVVLGGFSIGLFYFPSALALLLAGALTEARERRGLRRARHGVS